MVEESVGQLLVFFFFKQKTAYEMLRSLVGSEMCIRDSWVADRFGVRYTLGGMTAVLHRLHFVFKKTKLIPGCLLYTSDAADDLLCVDLGGRRIIKNKK